MMESKLTHQITLEVAGEAAMNTSDNTANKCLTLRNEDYEVYFDRAFNYLRTLNIPSLFGRSWVDRGQSDHDIVPCVLLTYGSPSFDVDKQLITDLTEARLVIDIY